MNDFNQPSPEPSSQPAAPQDDGDEEMEVEDYMEEISGSLEEISGTLKQLLEIMRSKGV